MIVEVPDDILENACLLIAMDDLFPDGYAGRQFIIDEIRLHDGFPSEKHPQLEVCAPVRYFTGGVINHYQGMSVAEFSQGGCTYSVPRSQCVVIIFENGERHNHASCIPVRNVRDYMNKYETAGFVIRTCDITEQQPKKRIPIVVS